ncbi:MAG: hypothetical protein Q7J27_12880, partial [Syntrophales bacterium]|nr:hypothetical protein [Syntrophales bacterium]
MSFFNILWQERTPIWNSTHHAIIHGMRETWHRCHQRGNIPQENDFIASIVLDSSPLIYNSLNQIFGKHKIHFSLTSVYCHQTPRVKYPGLTKKFCELGDILFVHVHKTRSGMYRRNALLYQAKVSPQQPYVVLTSETHQLKLYTEWPDFEYCNSGSLLNGKKRKINPKNPHSGAQYLLIDNRPGTCPNSGLIGLSGTYPIGSCMPDIYLYNHNDLASELFELFLLHTGQSFDDRTNSCNKENWSEVVWDLIDAGLRKSFNRRRSGRVSDPRISGGPVQL